MKGLPFKDGVTTEFEKFEESPNETKRTKTKVTTRISDPRRERVVDPPYFNVQTGD